MIKVTSLLILCQSLSGFNLKHYIPTNLEHEKRNVFAFFFAGVQS